MWVDETDVEIRSGEIGRLDGVTFVETPKASPASVLFAAAVAATGVSLDAIIDSLPKGSTPNCYKPHQGAKEMERRRKKMKGGTQ